MVTENEILKCAKLARIHLSDNEVDALTQDLEGIIAYIKKLENLNVDDVEPTSHALSLKNVYRKDEIKISFSQEESLKIAISKHKGSFEVPQIIEN